MIVLIVGSGGREHALAWRIAQSDGVDRVLVSPGNPGIAGEEKVESVTLSGAEEILHAGVDLVVIGPEEPLVKGLADQLRDAGLPVVGPSGEAARLEGSKAFAKDFMAACGVPTAEYRVCSTLAEAHDAIDELGAPVVVKADGLAAGKGVIVCDSLREAHAAADTIMRDRLFGEAGDSVVVERCLKGFEASIIVLLDESGYLILPTSQDHKAIGEGNTGPNTGGMGVVAPNPLIDASLLAKIEKLIVSPSVDAIRQRGWIFRGALFIGLMIDESGPKALEYNVRFGDPETQSILPLIGGDFAVLLRGLAAGALSDAAEEAGFSVRPQAACTVVAASPGYPGPYTRKLPIHVGDVGEAHVFYAGVQSGRDEKLETSGGRVLAVTAAASTLEDARRDAYAGLLSVRFDGMQFRRDIGGPSIIDEIVEEGSRSLLQFDKRGGVLPVVVQEATTGEVLMVAYTNREAYEETRRSGYACFWSTSRNALWKKGESSGDYLAIQEIRVDCDQDALLYRVKLLGDGVCHTVEKTGKHRKRCFYRTVDDGGSLRFDHP